MARKFVRSITGTSCTGDKQEPLKTNEQNDLLSDGKDVFIRNQNKYEKLTGKSEGGTGEIVIPEISFRLADNGNLYYKVDWE